MERNSGVAAEDDPLRAVGTVSAAPAHVLEIWAIVLVTLGTVILMSFLMFGPAASIIIYRIWKSPPQSSVV